MGIYCFENMELLLLQHKKLLEICSRKAWIYEYVTLLNCLLTHGQTTQFEVFSPLVQFRVPRPGSVSYMQLFRTFYIYCHLCLLCPLYPMPIWFQLPLRISGLSILKVLEFVHHLFLEIFSSFSFGRLSLHFPDASQWQLFSYLVCFPASS